MTVSQTIAATAPVSLWTRVPDGYVTEASCVGLPPGRAPGGLMQMPDNRMVMFATDWTRVFSNGELVAWRAGMAGTTYTIFND